LSVSWAGTTCYKPLVLSNSYPYSPDGRWYWDGAAWQPAAGAGPARAPGAMPHLGALLGVAARRRSSGLRIRLVMGALMGVFGIYIASTVWQLGAPLIAAPLAGVFVVNATAIVLGLLQSRPLVRIESDGVWMRRAWPWLAIARLAVGLLGLALAVLCAALLWLAGLGVVGIYLVVVSGLNVLAGAAQQVPIVRLSDGAPPAVQANGAPRSLPASLTTPYDRWVHVPWPAVRQVYSHQRFGLLAGITLDVDPTALRS
jgi:hypothetical protein